MKSQYPTFGEKLKEQKYCARYAAYIILAEYDQIVLIQAPNGSYFLPGGEIEKAETKTEALKRELIEELGMSFEVDRYIGQADEFFYSRYRNTYFYNPGYFYIAKSWHKICEPTEKNHQIVWVSIDQALNLLKRGSHRWALEKWQEMQ